METLIINDIEHILVETVGYELKIGDFILKDTGITKSLRSITRVDKKYAYVRMNDNFEQKYPKLYHPFNFDALPRQKWKTCKYKIFKKA